MKIKTETYINILPYFFQKLELENVNYAVLRGFENLPESYSNDIDFGVLKKNLPLFIKIIKSIAERYSYILKLRDLRLDVLKLSLSSNNDNIDIDIWSSFNYVGLYYLDYENILNDYTYYNGFKILKPENELALSYLKELLHMNRLREDKVKKLQKKLDSPFQIPLQEYFTLPLIDEFISSIKLEQFKLDNLAKKSKMVLLKKNILKRGLWRTILSVFKFIIVRLNRRNKIKKMEELIFLGNYTIAK